MTSKSRNDRYRIVDPRGHRVPLFIRLCDAFVDNLAQLLRFGLVVGALFLVRDLQVLRDLVVPEVEAPLAGEPVDRTDLADPVDETEGPWLTDGVRHALDCTHADYRNDHYDRCVEDGSEIYRRPGADPDDTGFIPAESPVLYARLGPD